MVWKKGARVWGERGCGFLQHRLINEITMIKVNLKAPK